MPYDVVRLAMIRACEKHGSGAKYLFCAAGFGLELKRIAGLEGGLDGNLVRAVLCGRDDVEILSGDAMFRMIPLESDPQPVEAKMVVEPELLKKLGHHYASASPSGSVEGFMIGGVRVEVTCSVGKSIDYWIQSLRAVVDLIEAEIVRKEKMVA